MFTINYRYLQTSAMARQRRRDAAGNAGPGRQARQAAAGRQDPAVWQQLYRQLRQDVDAVMQAILTIQQLVPELRRLAQQPRQGEQRHQRGRQQHQQQGQQRQGPARHRQFPGRQRQDDDGHAARPERRQDGPKVQIKTERQPAGGSITEATVTF